MSLTTRLLSTDINLPGLKCVAGEFDFDSSYPTGGESLDLSAYLDTVFGVYFEQEDGFELRYDKTNKKVLVYAPLRKYSAALNPASLATDAVNSTAVTVTGVAATDELVAIQPAAALEAGIVIQSARVTGVNEITVEVSNTSAGTVDAASATCDFYVRKALGAGYEVADTADLSGLTKIGFFAIGTKS